MNAIDPSQIELVRSCTDVTMPSVNGTLNFADPLPLFSRLRALDLYYAFTQEHMIQCNPERLMFDSECLARSFYWQFKIMENLETENPLDFLSADLVERNERIMKCIRTSVEQMKKHDEQDQVYAEALLSLLVGVTFLSLKETAHHFRIVKPYYSYHIKDFIRVIAQSDNLFDDFIKNDIFTETNASSGILNVGDVNTIKFLMDSETMGREEREKTIAEAKFFKRMSVREIIERGIAFSFSLWTEEPEQKRLKILVLQDMVQSFTSNYLEYSRRDDFDKVLCTDPFSLTAQIRAHQINQSEELIVKEQEASIKKAVEFNKIVEGINKIIDICSK
jgi:hypothetical protein